MRKAALLVILLAGIGFPALTMEQAGTTAQQYADTGESVNIHPQGLTYSGSASYWVMELIGQLGRVNVMLPINVDTEQVETGDAIKDVLKTHYLANYFATDDTIADFLQSTFTYRQGKKTDYNAAFDQLGLYEAQLPSDVVLVNLQPLKDSITATNTKNDELKDYIQTAQGLISAVNWRTADVGATQTAMAGVFSSEESFLDGMDEVKTNANAFLTELAANIYLKTSYPNLVQAFQGIITSYRLTEDTTQKRDTLTPNQNAINTFFADLDQKSDEYVTKLRSRMDSHLTQTEIQLISDALTTYNTNYTYINNYADTISPTYSGDITDLHDAIAEAQAYFNQDNYTQAKAQFDSIDNLIETLASHMGECPPDCTGGKAATSECTCACPAGTTESSGQCLASGGLNMTLIGGLVLIIVVLIIFKYKDKFFKGGGKIEEKPSDMWANYKF